MHPLLPRYEAFSMYFTQMTEDFAPSREQRHWDVLLKCWCTTHGFDYEATVIAFNTIESELDRGLHREVKLG